MTAKTARHARRSPERREANRQASLEAFMREKARFDALVADLQRMSEDHFGADPEQTLWTEAASLAFRNSLLQQVTDGYFKRGEFAA